MLDSRAARNLQFSHPTKRRLPIKSPTSSCPKFNSMALFDLCKTKSKFCKQIKEWILPIPKSDFCTAEYNTKSSKKVSHEGWYHPTKVLTFDDRQVRRWRAWVWGGFIDVFGWKHGLLGSVVTTFLFSRPRPCTNIYFYELVCWRCCGVNSKALKIFPEPKIESSIN